MTTLQEAIKIYGELLDQWSPEKAETYEAAWVDLRQPFSHLYSDACIDDQVGPGWWVLLIEAFTAIDAAMVQHPGYRFSVRQIKEKFGGLRFYFMVYRADLDPTDEDTRYPEDGDTVQEGIIQQIYEIIRAAEEKADVTCETCGEPGTLRSGGWMKTLCDLHDQKAAIKRGRN